MSKSWSFNFEQIFGPLTFPVYRGNKKHSSSTFDDELIQLGLLLFELHRERIIDNICFL